MLSFMPIIAAIGFVALFVYWIMTRKNERAPIPATVASAPQADAADLSKLKERYGESVFCRVADNITATIYNAYVPIAEIADVIKTHGALGRQRNREGKQVYGLNRYQDEDSDRVKYRPIDNFIPKGISHAPTELHNSIKQPEIAIAIKAFLDDDKNKLLDSILKYLPWLVGLAFILFMWSQSAH